MHKTTVYLSDDEAAALRRKAAEDGRSQSELIREGIRRVVGEPRRVFRSMGIGRGDGTRELRHSLVSERERAMHGRRRRVTTRRRQCVPRALASAASIATRNESTG